MRTEEDRPQKEVHAVRENWFCPHEKCEHYGTATRYPRKCYYEPQCWKGYADAIIFVIMLRFRLLREKGQQGG